jgi:hypothetical protein
MPLRYGDISLKNRREGIRATHLMDEVVDTWELIYSRSTHAKLERIRRPCGVTVGRRITDHSIPRRT